TRWEDFAAHQDSNESARHVRGTELRLRNSLHATLRLRSRHPSSSEVPRQGHGTELMLHDSLRATLPIYSGKFLTCINSTLRFYFKLSDISCENVGIKQLS
ncbi:hypothetical protein HAX54_039586, partial [Datura stramonium]|nr:hypothetical protein [Datura stramonium]